ncbi:hypothetical protein [Rhodomicrobium udaipurense]|uniref:PH domain-containing protein n=1 Tax=Rhodomicrobium udaipurense TaxID=1202716 RepID=A0A8I1G9U5_9HYPH|nr:hypothetical protein [Rhodomicrobium udaipurense]MBJ7543182.1 hypothetical protein [Rhodomicrobium udaipurense]
MSGIALERPNRQELASMPESTTLKAKLLPEEKVMWSGRPRQGLMFYRADAFIIPFSIVWTMGAWSGISNGLNKHAALLPTLMALLFLAVGFWLLIGRFVYDIWRRSRLTYAVTDRRVLILRGENSCTSLDIANLPAPRLDTYGSNGSGSIIFGVPQTGWAREPLFWPDAGVPNFIWITGARDVFTLIMQLSHPSPNALAAREETSQPSSLS